MIGEKLPGKGKMDQNTPQALENMCGLPYPPQNPPGNWKMVQNTPQALGKHVLDTFMHHPGVIPGPGGSKNGCFLGREQPK